MSAEVKDEKIVPVLLKRRSKSKQFRAVGLVTMTKEDQRGTPDGRNEPTFKKLVIVGTKGQCEVIPEEEAAGIYSLSKSVGSDDAVGREGCKPNNENQNEQQDRDHALKCLTEGAFRVANRRNDFRERIHANMKRRQGKGDRNIEK